MKKGQSKAKGGKFERVVCKLLSLWISSGQQEDIFWRSSMSGGRATVAKKSGKTLKASCGDISAIDPLGKPFLDKFFVECKHVKSYNLGTFLLYGKGAMATDWSVAVKQAHEYNKTPLFICNLSSLGIIAVMPSYVKFPMQDYCWRVYVPEMNVVVYLFKQLLDEWKYE